jgi:cell division protein FtsL
LSDRHDLGLKMEIEKKDEKKIFNRLKAVILLILVFTALFVIIYRYGEMINLNYDITSLNSELREKSAVNSSLYADLDRTYNIDEVKNIAETKLDMNKPKQDQLIYIDLEMSDEYESQEKDDFYSKTQAFFEKIKYTVENVIHIFSSTKKD